MSSAGVGPLCFIKTRVNAAGLSGHFRALHAFFSGQSWTWHLPTLPKQPKPGSMTMGYCPWLASKLLPDLNPIENLWGIAKRKMRDMRPTNAKELKAAIEASWSSITPQQCHRLIASMPRRIKAVIHAKGGPTKYWVHMHDYTFHRANISLFKILFLLISCNILIFWDFEFGVFRSCTSLASKL